MQDRPPPDVVDRITASPRWRSVDHRQVVDSTNTVVAQLAARGEPPGLVVVADHQTQGRGRLDRSWQDQPGGSLAVTALVAAPDRPTLVPMAAGLSVVDAAAAQGVRTSLKWPNDVLTAGGRKCSGVLIETAGDGHLAVGIGVNVDWRERGDDVDRSWGSLAEERGGDVDRWQVLADLLRSLDGHLTQIHDAPERLLDTYRRRCGTLGREVRVELSDDVLVGTAEDVAEDGSLLVRTVDRTVPVHAGDVHHVRPTSVRTRRG